MPDSVSRPPSVVAMRQSYVRRSAQDDRAQARLWFEAELRVQIPHRFVALLARGNEASVAGSLCRDDLRLLQSSSNAAPPPVPRHGGHTVKRVAHVIVEHRVADGLITREGDEKALRIARRPVDVDRAPL